VIHGGLNDDQREKGKSLTLVQNDLLKRGDKKEKEEGEESRKDIDQSGGKASSSNEGGKSAKVILIKKDSYIEPEAITQLETTAKLLNMVPPSLLLPCSPPPFLAFTDVVFSLCRCTRWAFLIFIRAKVSPLALRPPPPRSSTPTSLVRLLPLLRFPPYDLLSLLSA